MTKPWAELTIGGDEFHLKKNIEITTGVRTGFLVGGSGSTANHVFHDLVDDEDFLNNSTSEGMRAGVHIDEGGGVRMVQIEFQTYEGNSDQFGNATGEDVFTQADELIHTIETTEIDSRFPATLEYSTYEDGHRGPIDVVFEEPMMTLSTDKFGIAEGSLTCLKTANLSRPWDAMKRLI